MRHQDTLRSVTHLFPGALGLRLLPVGLWFLAISIPGLRPFPGPLHLVLGLLAALSIWPIHRWYRARYGFVQPERLRFGRNWAILLGLVVAGGALGLGAALPGVGTLVLTLVLVLFGTAVAFALPQPFPGGRLAAVLLLLVAGLCAVLLITLTRDPAPLGSMGGLFSRSVGALLCLAGVIEHRLLTRALDKLGESAGD